LRLRAYFPDCQITPFVVASHISREGSPIFRDPDIIS